MPPSPDAEAPPERRPGRFRAAVAVLKGESLVPDQIRWEWLEYQQTFGDVLQRMSALLARQAKAEGSRVRALAESLSSLDQPLRRDPAPPRSHKDDLRHRAAQLRGLRLPSASTRFADAGSPLPQPNLLRPPSGSIPSADANSHPQPPEQEDQP